MKYSKKLASLLVAAIVAIPMTVTSFADGAVIPFTKVDESGNKLAGAEIQFYKETSLLFTATTNSEGKLVASGTTEYLNDNGELKLEKDGEYYYKEIKAPNFYMLNTDTNKFSVIGGQSDAITFENKKIPDGKGQLILSAIDKNTKKGLEGATIELYKKVGTKKDVVATLTTDGSGNVMNVFALGTANAGLEAVGTGLAINPGTYYVKENKAPQGYFLVDKELPITVNKGGQATVTIEHTLNDGRTPNPNPQNNRTGVKISATNITTNKPMENLDIAIYSVDDVTKKVSTTELFIGRTGKEGTFTSASLGSALLADGIVDLKPGEYVAKIYKNSTAKEHKFSVVQGKVTPLTIKTATVSTGGSTGKKSSNTKTGSTSSSTLAKTGSENKQIFSVLGIGVVALGIFLIKKR